MTTSRQDPREVGRLFVHRGQRLVGLLERTERGARFSYSSEVLVAKADFSAMAVAFCMPVRGQPYEIQGDNLHPFFAGLLPEGRRFEALVKRSKSSADDLFTLLVAAGSDTIGDVFATTTEAQEPQASIDTAMLAQSSFAQLSEASLAGTDPVAIAGIQPKISTSRIAIPAKSKAEGTHCILKFQTSGYPRIVENEAYCMALANACGIETAKARIVHDRKGLPGLLVTRFDRIPDGKGNVLALHQEDACQLLDRYPSDKYRLEVRDITAALEVCTAPLVERLRWLELVAFSYAIGNGDLHGKNVSVLVRDGNIRMAPAYDLLSTLPYGDRRQALKLDGRDDRLQRKHFLEHGERFGLRPQALGNGAKLHGDRSAPISALVYRIALDVSVSVVACRASSAASALLVQ